MAYGKIKDGKVIYAPEVYESSRIRIENFNTDIQLMQEFGYKEIYLHGYTDGTYVTKQRIEEGEDIISIYYDIDDSKEVLDVIKANKVNKTRINLAEYLEANPLISTAKGGVELPYTVTMEKQNQLTATIADFISSALPYIIQAIGEGVTGEAFTTYMDNLPIEISWNSQGETCETWKYSEIFQLKNEVMGYVKPIVEYQRYLEKTIVNCTGQIEINEIDISFTKEILDAYLNPEEEV